MKKTKLLKTLLTPTIGITAIGTIAAVSTSCSSTAHVTGVSLSKEILALEIGDSDILTATVYPDDASDKSVTWSSSDSSIATVDNNGNVVGVSEGQTTITVTTKDGAFTDTCQVTVHQEIIHVIGVWLDKESLSLGVGDSDTLTATVHPYDASDKSVTWTSSDSSVATVNSHGTITAIAEGTATITVKTNDGGFTDTCQVTVQIFVTSVSLDKESLALEIGGYETLTATVHPDDASDKSVTWSSSDSSVATVDNNGNVTAVSEGSAKITVKTNDGGYEDYCNVTVNLPYICVTANADSTFYLTNKGVNNPNLQYSVDRKIWHNYSDHIKIPTDTNLYLKGNNQNGWSQSNQNYSHFKITGNASLSGSIMGLLDNGTRTISLIPNDYCFYGLFSNTTGITSVSKIFLPATTLADYCYDSMFQGCTSLTSAPDLPATTLAADCYAGMFMGCTSLKNIPNTLPATTLAAECYANMFRGCASLTTTPDLPATTLAQGCYRSMFEQCISLTTAPKLPATTLADHCYSYMFQGCLALTTAPNLPAITLDRYCYWNMFKGCTSLITAPALPAEKLAEWCYVGMFDGCTSLTSAPETLPSITLLTYCYSYMFQGCTSLTTAPNLPATTLSTYCYLNMFGGCTSLTTAPTLPATTLANGCYANMFSNCKSLTTAPELPATTLAPNCYGGMFQGCALLTSIRIGYTGTVADAPTDAFSEWVNLVPNHGIFYYKGSDTLENFGFPFGWIVIPN